MPLKLRAPRPGKTPYYSVRGKYLGVKLEQSLGTAKRSVALRLIAELEAKIERREYPAPPRHPDGPTFLNAAVAYMEAGGSRRYVAHLIRHFGETPLDAIDQAAIDAAAIALHPNVTAAARNVYVYTPVSAILHHAGVNITLRRPAGAKGRVRTDWINPTDARAIIAAAETLDPEFAELLLFLLYTGCRLGEALVLTWEYVAFPKKSAGHHAKRSAATAYIATSKNDDPRTVRLRPDLALRLARRQQRSGRVWRFHQGGWLKTLLLDAKLLACGLPRSARPKKGERRRASPHRLAFVNFHTFCHTWATWMRRYGHADLKGLVATGRWRDERSASRYAHVVAAEEWERVDILPAVTTPAAARSSALGTARVPRRRRAITD